METKYSDDLSSFRKIIVWVSNNKKPLYANEVGIAELVIRGLVPVIVNGEYLGSVVEFIQSFNLVVNYLNNKYGLCSVVTLKSEFSKNASFVSKDKKIGNLIEFGKFSHKLEKELNSKLIKNSSFFTKNYFVIKIPLKDFTGRVVGYYFLADEKSDVIKIVNQSKKYIYLIIGIVASIFIVIGIVVFFLMFKFIFKPIDNFRAKIEDLSEGEGDLTKRIEVQTNDEIGEVANHLNKFIDKLANIISNLKMQVNNLENEVKTLNTNITHIDNVIDKENESLKLSAETNNALEDVSKESVKTKKFISNMKMY